jgi:16S rRNA (cytidine(1402)-2'-O)-methyltransferase
VSLEVRRCERFRLRPSRHRPACLRCAAAQPRIRPVLNFDRIMSEPASSMPPALYVVATPLGNLGDITLRALEVLRAADLVAAEDTRHTRRLLDHHGIGTRLVAAHEHNEREAAESIIAAIGEGRRVALVSDAGTPAVSDPGARVVRAVADAGQRVIPVPGPSALTAALSASGLTDAHVLFCGFLPAKAAARGEAIEALRAVDAALVFYEAPHRVAETIDDLAALTRPDDWHLHLRDGDMLAAVLPDTARRSPAPSSCPT